MTLSRKTFVFGSIIAGIIVVLMIVYFICMLPSLYVAHMQESNLQSAISVQKKFIKEGDYKNISSVNPMGTVTIKIPSRGNVISFYNKLCSVNVTIKDKEIQKIIDKIRSYTVDTDNIEKLNEKDFDFSEELGSFFKNKVFRAELPMSFELMKNDFPSIYKEASTKFHPVDNKTVVIELNAYDGENNYTNYIAFSRNKGDLIISALSAITPQIREIKPIVLQSLPMIISVALLIVLLATVLFSRKIVQPIEKLVNHAVFMKENTNREIEPVEVNGHDEIAVLGETLNELYYKLYKNYKELEQKNSYLFEQNKRQEVFLRASSHQLKTPVSAALLLVEGMINEVGKYKDTKEHLPRVKLQLQAMKKIIDEILSLNSNVEDYKKEYIDLLELVDEILLSHEVQIKLKELSVDCEAGSMNINSDRTLIYKIIDNLITNAVNFTPKKGRIHIKLTEKALTAINYGVQIEEELLPHIFDPFVSSNSESRGHGLGLYIVAYYADLLGAEVTVKNIGNGVESKIEFPD